MKLAAAHLEKLDTLSKPALNFPAEFLAFSAAVLQGGTTINGRAAPVWPMSPDSDGDRY